MLRDDRAALPRDARRENRGRFRFTADLSPRPSSDTACGCGSRGAADSSSSGNWSSRTTSAPPGLFGSGLSVAPDHHRRGRLLGFGGLAGPIAAGASVRLRRACAAALRPSPRRAARARALGRRSFRPRLRLELQTELHRRIEESLDGVERHRALRHAGERQRRPRNARRSPRDPRTGAAGRSVISSGYCSRMRVGQLHARRARIERDIEMMLARQALSSRRRRARCARPRAAPAGSGDRSGCGRRPWVDQYAMDCAAETLACATT